MFSLNVPLPGAVRRRVESLRPHLAGFETVREDPTLVVKRFGRVPPDEAARIESEVRLALAGAPAFEARVDGLGAFEAPVSGPAPVVYLAVESPGLEGVHARLVEAFGAVPGLEGDDYVPHVTLARGGERTVGSRASPDGTSDGGDPAGLDALLDREVDPVEWTVSELWFWDARHGERAGRVSLPG